MNGNLISAQALYHRFTHNAHVYRKLPIIIGVLFLSMFLPFIASQTTLQLLAAALLGIGGLYIFLRWPPLGYIAAIVGGMVFPYRGPSGLNVTILIIALLLLLWLLDMVVRQRRIAFVFSQTTVPLVIFVVASLVSFTMGQIPWYMFAQSAPLGAQAGGLAIFLLSAGAFLMVANQVQDEYWLKVLVGVFLAAGALYIAGRLLPPVRPIIVQRLFQRGATDSLFWTWLVALALSQAIFNRKLDQKWRAALLILVVATFYVAFSQASKWKSGWVPPAVCVAVIVWLRSWRLGLLLSLLSLLPAYGLWQQSLVEDDYSIMTRTEAWTIVTHIVQVNPILGLGFANYRWYTPLFPILGWAVFFNSHHQYVDIIAQTGLVGIASFMWFFWRVGRLGWYLRHRVPQGFAKAYIYGALAGLLGTLMAGMLGDWVLPFFYNIGLKGFRASVLAWLFLGGIVVFERMYGKAVEQADELPYPSPVG